jgi:predicted translin family RNA/ssDNA-binding protein
MEMSAAIIGPEGRTQTRITTVTSAHGILETKNGMRNRAIDIGIGIDRESGQTIRAIVRMSSARPRIRKI